MTEQELNDEITRLTILKDSIESEVSEKQNTLNGINSEIDTKTKEKNNLINLSNEINQTNESLNQEIRGKRDIISAIEVEIKAKQSHQETLNAEVSGLNEIKNSTDQEVKGKQNIIESLVLEINSKTAQTESLNSEINTLNTTKATIEDAIASNTPIKSKLSSDIEDLNFLISQRNKALVEQENEKNNLENQIKLLRDKSDLYSNDIAGIGEDNKKQRNNYLIGVTVSFLVTMVFICILVCSVKNAVELPDTIKDMFKGNPRLLFTVLLLMRISLLGTLFVLIFVFLNLARGFISQYIKTQEKMTAVRLLDFLVNKIGKETSKLEAAENLAYETKKLEKQNDLLNKHLPELIEYSPSSFDKISKTKSPMEIAETIGKEVGKALVEKINLKKKEGEN